MLTDLFFIVNFSLSILASIVGLILSLIMIVIVATHRSCRTVTNLLTCNTSLLIAMYCICNFVSSIYGLREDWALKQPACLFRAYCFIMISGSICYSYLIQAISRLFFTVFFKHKYLVTYRVHWRLIALNWIIGTLYSVEPFFFDGGFIFETESRLCTLTTKKFSTSMYAIVTGFIVPLSISIVVYGTIFYRCRTSSRRIAALPLNTLTSHTPNTRREMKLARNMMILEGIFAGVGTPYLILVLWHGIQLNIPPPESFYLLSINAVSAFFAFTMIALFCMNKPVKDTALGYLHSKWTFSLKISPSERTITDHPTLAI